MRYWLLKSEPRSYSIDDLARDKRTPWDGVRNYQARNFMRDSMQVGDKVLFYHSSTDPVGIVGMATVCSKSYPDKTAFDPKNPHFDPKSKKENPTWMLVDICFEKKCKHIIRLKELKENPVFDGMLVIQRGIRLSVQPVDKKHFDAVHKLAK